MIQKALQDYIQQNLQRGTSHDIISTTLVSKGWAKQDVDDSFASLETTTTTQTVGALPSSPDDITEKTYPIQPIWVIQSVIVSVLAVGYLALRSKTFGDFLILLALYIVYILIHVGYVILRRRSFHYVISKSYMELRQGVVSKQQRHIPLGVIQNVFVKQGFLDRIFQLASLTIENAAQTNAKKGGFIGMLTGANDPKKQIIGFSSNGSSVSIPGLKKQHAEELKTIILERMKANPVEANRSGL